MTSFHFEIPPRDRKASRFFGAVLRELRKAIAVEGLSMAEIGRRLGVNRSVVTRQVGGKANLTLRTLADLAWATDHEIVFQLKRPTATFGQNIAPLPSADEAFYEPPRPKTDAATSLLRSDPGTFVPQRGQA